MANTSKDFEIIPIAYNYYGEDISVTSDPYINILGKNVSSNKLEVVSTKSIINKSINEDDTFILDQMSMIIPNKPIPKNSKVYIEITINSHEPLKDLRHLALQLGVIKMPKPITLFIQGKETLYNILYEDHCLGSVYYTKGENNKYNNDPNYLAYIIYERYNKSLDKEYQFINTPKTKVPLINDVLGLCVDMIENKITILNNGEEFYSFSPQSFHLNEDPEDFYLCMYYILPNKEIKGFFNIGRNYTKYHPLLYYNLYEEYFLKKKYYYNLTSSLTVLSDIPPIEKEEKNLFNEDIINKYPINKDANQRLLYFIYNNLYMEYYYEYTDESNKVIRKYNDSNFIFHKSSLDTSSTQPDTAMLAYQIPIEPRIYFEFSCNNSYVNYNEYFGIPLSIGISDTIIDSQKTISNHNAIKINLFRKSLEEFKMYIYKDGSLVKRTIGEGEDLKEYDYFQVKLLNPSLPRQGNIIGVLLDLISNKITIYTHGVEFIEATIPELTFTATENYYLFFETETDALLQIVENNEILPNTGYVSCNFGGLFKNNFQYENLIKDDFPYTMSLYYYYNYLIKDDYNVDIPVFLNILPKDLIYYHYIYTQLYVGTNIHDYDGPGLNSLLNNHVIIEDINPHHNEPDRTFFQMNRSMSTTEKRS